jgi:tripartite-type tricarboxylate transporter receptor subunit TctC
VQLAIVSTAAAAPLIGTKKVNVLAATSPKRLAALPDVPMIAADYKGYSVISTFGFLVPAATPAAIIKRLNAELSAVVQSSDVKAKFAEQGIDAVSSTPAEFKALMETEVELWGRVIRDSHITVN